MTDTLYLVFDESGNFDFGNSGTQYFVLACVGTLRPISSIERLLSVRYQLLREGLAINSFHASQDRQHVRNMALSAISKSRPLQIASVSVRKTETPKSKMTREDLFTSCAIRLLACFMKELYIAEIERIVLIFDVALPNRERSHCLGELKKLLKDSGKGFSVYFQGLSSEYLGQIADYVAWSKYVSLERGESRPINQLRAAHQIIELAIPN